MPKSKPIPTREALNAEIERLRASLLEAEETLQAIRSGEVDALLVNGPDGEQVFTLRGAEHGYRVLVETMSEGALTMRPDGTIYYANARLAEFVGLSLEKIIGAKVQQFLAPGEVAAFELLLKQDGNRRGEFHLQSEAGGATPVLMSMNSGPEGDELGSICLVATNLTEQKRVIALQEAQVTLQESERRFRTLADAIPQLSWTCRADGKCDYLSQQWIDYTGRTAAEQLGFAWLDTIHPDDRDRSFAAWKQAFEGGGTYDLEFRIQARDGTFRWFKTRGTPVRHADGKILKWFGTSTDIEDIVQARHVIAQSREALETLVQQRTAELEETTEQLNDFCYSIAHDLRAPLRAQTAYAKILLEDYSASLGETGQHYANRIIVAADKLDRLVQDLLSHVSLSRGDLPLEVVELALVVAQVRADFSEQIRKTTAKITVQVAGGVWGHESSLVLIVSNLLSNALKYCKPGTAPVVTIRTEITAGDTIRLWVEDEGIGIKPEYHERIFGVFQRLHTSDIYSGTGIGLALVRKGIERMGGKVGVESMPAKGSRFWIDLPAAKQ